MSEIFTIRIPRDVKEKMKKYPHVNWSEVARKAILERLAVEESREEKMEACREMDRIRGEIARQQYLHQQLVSHIPPTHYRLS